MQKNIIFIFFFIYLTASFANAQLVESDLNLLMELALDKNLNYEEKEKNYQAIGSILLNKKNSRKETDVQIKAFVKGRDSTDVSLLYSILNKSLGQSDPEYGLHFLNQGLPYISSSNNKNYADFYGNIGTNYAIMGVDDIALKYMLIALSYINKEKPTNYIPVKRLLLNNITEMYLSQKNLPLAVHYHQISLELDEDQSSKESGLSLYSKISELRLSAEISQMQGKEKQAKNFLLKGIEISKKISHTDGESELLLKLGEFEQDINKSINYLQQAYEITHSIKARNAQSINSSLKLINSYLHILETNPNRLDSKYTKSYLFNQVEHLLGEVRNDIKIIDSKKDLAATYKLISRFEKIKGNFETALEYKEKFFNLNDSIYSQENKNKLAALQSANEIELRDKEITIGKATIKEKEKQTWFLIIGLTIVSILGGLVLYQNRLTQRKNKELDEANRVKTRFFSILNHDLRSPVGDLIRFLYLKKENPELLDNETKERLDNQTMEAAENLLVSMEDLLLWSKGQMENFQPQSKNISVNKLFDEIKSNFFGKENVLFSFENTENVKLFTDKNYLRTIIRNLTSNSVKALSETPDAKINWKAYKEKDRIILSITDNGPGGSDEQFRALYDDKFVVGIKTGLGLHVVRDMAKAIDCKVEVNSNAGKGTTIYIIFKKN